MTDENQTTSCRVREGHRYESGKCIWCDAEQTTSNWRADGSFVYRLVWDGEASVNQYSILVQRGHHTSEPDCVVLAKRIAALLNAAEYGETRHE